MKRYAVDAGEKAAYHAELEEQVKVNKKLSQKEEIRNHLKLADFENQVRERREHEALERQNNQEVRKSPKKTF